MNFTKAPIMTLSVSIMSGLLPVLAAGCSFEKQAEKAPAAERTEVKPFTANVFCLACHADLETDELAARHDKAGIGCERCHGESERHRSDEANITPPDLMYPRARINPTCMMCHPRQKIEGVESHKIILAGAETVFDEEKPDSKKVVCTDCHAREHKIKLRTIRWDKATGRILDQ